MKDQIIMSKTNGNLAITVPLYRIMEIDRIEVVESYVICLNSTNPIAYAVDMGDSIQLLNADFLQDQVEWLGEL